MARLAVSEILPIVVARSGRKVRISRVEQVVGPGAVYVHFAASLPDAPERKMVGLVTAHCYEEPTTISGGKPRSCWPSSEVDEDLRGQGIGTRLYEAAARWACDHGYSFGSDITLSRYSKRFWRKQLRKGRARAVKVGFETSGGYRAWPRYVLPCPPPASLDGVRGHRPRWRGWW